MATYTDYSTIQSIVTEQGSKGPEGTKPGKGEMTLNYKILTKVNDSTGQITSQTFEIVSNNPEKTSAGPSRFEIKTAWTTNVSGFFNIRLQIANTDSNISTSYAKIGEGPEGDKNSDNIETHMNDTFKNVEPSSARVATKLNYIQVVELKDPDTTSFFKTKGSRRLIANSGPHTLSNFSNQTIYFLFNLFRNTKGSIWRWSNWIFFDDAPPVTLKTRSITLSSNQVWLTNTTGDITKSTVNINRIPPSAKEPITLSPNTNPAGTQISITKSTPEKLTVRAINSTAENSTATRSVGISDTSVTRRNLTVSFYEKPRSTVKLPGNLKNINIRTANSRNFQLSPIQPASKFSPSQITGSAFFVNNSPSSAKKTLNAYSSRYNVSSSNFLNIRSDAQNMFKLAHENKEFKLTFRFRNNVMPQNKTRNYVKNSTISVRWSITPRDIKQFSYDWIFNNNEVIANVKALSSTTSKINYKSGHNSLPEVIVVGLGNQFPTIGNLKYDNNEKVSSAGYCRGFRVEYFTGNVTTSTSPAPANRTHYYESGLTGVAPISKSGRMNPSKTILDSLPSGSLFTIRITPYFYYGTSSMTSDNTPGLARHYGDSFILPQKVIKLEEKDFYCPLLFPVTKTVSPYTPMKLTQVERFGYLLSDAVLNSQSVVNSSFGVLVNNVDLSMRNVKYSSYFSSDRMSKRIIVDVGKFISDSFKEGLLDVDTDSCKVTPYIDIFYGQSFVKRIKSVGRIDKIDSGIEGNTNLTLETSVFIDTRKTSMWDPINNKGVFLDQTSISYEQNSDFTTSYGTDYINVPSNFFTGGMYLRVYTGGGPFPLKLSDKALWVRSTEILVGEPGAHKRLNVEWQFFDETGPISLIRDTGDFYYYNMRNLRYAIISDWKGSDLGFALRFDSASALNSPYKHHWWGLNDSNGKVGLGLDYNDLAADGRVGLYISLTNPFNNSDNYHDRSYESVRPGVKKGEKISYNDYQHFQDFIDKYRYLVPNYSTNTDSFTVNPIPKNMTGQMICTEFWIDIARRLNVYSDSMKQWIGSDGLVIWHDSIFSIKKGTVIDNNHIMKSLYQNYWDLLIQKSGHDKYATHEYLNKMGYTHKELSSFTHKQINKKEGL